METNSSCSQIVLGNRVPRGCFTAKHSHHSKVVNFLAGDRVISVCAACLSPGPYRLILNTDSVESIHSVCNSGQELVLNNLIIIFTTGCRTYTCPEFEALDCNISIAERIKAAYHCFTNQATEDCVRKLGQNTINKKDNFSACLGENFNKGIRHLQQENYSQAIKCFRHQGRGLTPAGDDFLVGLLLGASWIQEIEKKELSKIRQLILAESKGTNPLGNHFLSKAYMLELDEDWAQFLMHLGSDGGDYQPWQNLILSHGSSSGADELSGFYLACSLFGKMIAIDV